MSACQERVQLIGTNNNNNNNNHNNKFQGGGQGVGISGGMGCKDWVHLILSTTEFQHVATGN
jgi:hypothetical protein